MKQAIFLLAVFFSLKTYATTYTAVANGNFESASTWSPAGGPPGAGDNVVIPAGLTVTVTATNTALLNSLDLAGTLVFTNGSKLSFSSTAIIQVSSGGNISDGNGGSKLVFPSISYSGPFSTTGPFFYTNTGSGSGILPISLLSFNTTVDNNAVKISWQTENEINVAAYELQWSATGIDNWKFIYLQAPNNVVTLNNYSYTQSVGLLEKNYYRLKTVEKNGEFTYSFTTLAIKSNKLKFQISPIAENSLLCKMSSSDVSTIKITDISGRVISVANNIHDVQYTLYTGNLPKGIYFVSLLQNNGTYTEKFFKK